MIYNIIEYVYNWNFYRGVVMKKIFYIFLILLNTLLISSCSSESKDYETEKLSPNDKIELSTVLPEADTETPIYNIKDFLPTKKNTEYSFSRGTENEIVKEYVEFLEEDKIQIKSVSGTRIAS